MSSAMHANSDHAAQQRYHDELFGSLKSWDSTRAQIVALTGDQSREGLLGLDQLGHFGPHGADLIVDCAAHHMSPGDLNMVVELGSGYGGVLRHVVNALRDRGYGAPGVGIELLPDEAIAAARVSDSLSDSSCVFLSGSADRAPLRSSSTACVFICGSAAHFPDADALFEEIRRVLLPGGLLVVVEEVSLLSGVAEPASRFFDLHPRGVFHFSTIEKREDALRRAGMNLLSKNCLAVWARPLLEARLKALTLFKGSMENILGTHAVERLVETLECTIEELGRGSVAPWMYRAMKPLEAAR